jgi:hypothetical protein
VLTLKQVEQWAYGDSPTQISGEFSDLFDDSELFEHEVSNICCQKKLLEFASDAKCKQRYFFANLLTDQILWIYRGRYSLPFHFARSRGIMTWEEYMEKISEQAKRVYENCEIIDLMRDSGDEAVQALYKQLMDFRHDAVNKANSDLYIACVRALSSGALKRFRWQP